MQTLSERLKHAAIAANKSIIDIVEDAGIRPADDADLESWYREMLDESGPVEIAGLKYEVSQALEAVDPVAYRCGYNDYTDASFLELVDLDGAVFYIPIDDETTLESYLDDLEEAASAETLPVE